MWCNLVVHEYAIVHHSVLERRGFESSNVVEFRLIWIEDGGGPSEYQIWFDGYLSRCQGAMALIRVCFEYQTNFGIYRFVEADLFAASIRFISGS